MNTILFVTGNQRKLSEARLGCALYGVEITNKSFDIDEIQSTSPQAVAEHKARTAYQLAGEPVVVTDTCWSIPALNGFPGAYMKDVANWFIEQDFLNLMAGKNDSRISFTENIAYYDGTILQFFSKQYWGAIVPARGTGNSLENVAEFEGKTLGERRSEGGYSHRPEDFIWAEFAKWYSELKEPA